MLMKQKILYGTLSIIGFVIIAIAAYVIATQQPNKNITSFEECVAAGYSVQNSYPEKCSVPGKKTFTKEIPHDQSMEFEGVIVCLPHKNTDGPHTLECATGLKTDDGTYYSLATKEGDTSLATAAGSEKRVRMHGAFKESSDTKYQSKSTITVNHYEFIK